MISDVVILDGARTAIGAFGGALKEHPPVTLGEIVAREALSRSRIDPQRIEQVIFGNVIHTEPRDMYLSRAVGLGAGLSTASQALTLNRLCGSGLQAVVSAVHAIGMGDADFVLAGGAESMSRAPHASRSVRTGQKMGDAMFVDMMVGALTDPFGHGHMGETAENVADRHSITREDQDDIAAESHRRAATAINEGRFKEQIVPVEVRRGRDVVMFETDEHVRLSATVEDFQKLRPVFRKNGSVTAGNASGINDGAAAMVLASAKAAAAEGLKPRARLVAYAVSGVAPEFMGMGPVHAVKRLLARTGMSISDFDVIESNEAFAAQACAVARELKLDSNKVNPNGGAIALGHPIGASGAILLVKCLAELDRISSRYGLVTMCIGGGQGIAVAVERLG